MSKSGDATSAAPGGELRKALSNCRSALIGLAFFSAVVNILMLTGSIFMLEVYDRVLPSRSIPTLVGLCLIAGALYLFQAGLEIVRSRLFVRIGSYVSEQLAPRAFELALRLPLYKSDADATGPIRDLDTLRSFLSGQGPGALFDLPWLPFYLAICFAFHPLIGLTALFGVVVLAIFTLATERLSRRSVAAASQESAGRTRLLDACRRGTEAISAMGMGSRMAGAWLRRNDEYVAAQTRASDTTASFASLGKVFRMMLQSAILAVGAWLVIRQEASPGIIIASSILSGRALAPLDLAIANWKGFMAARQSWGQLGRLFAAIPPREAVFALPAPSRELAVNTVSAGPAGSKRLTIANIQFTLKAGSVLCVIGHSAAGKSTLARVLVGLWRPARGSVLLDGASLDQWDPESLGPHIGYLPQEVELLEGSIADNISRFAPGAPTEAVIAAARCAGVHDLIVSLPDGYNTLIGDRGLALSAGQRQRVALARALYGDPFLVVLDEPNSNLDTDGETALTGAVQNVRARGGVVVLISHRPSALASCDFILTLAGGEQKSFAPRNEAMAQRGPRREPPPLGAFKIIPQQQGA